MGLIQRKGNGCARSSKQEINVFFLPGAVSAIKLHLVAVSHAIEYRDCPPSVALTIELSHNI